MPPRSLLRRAFEHIGDDPLRLSKDAVIENNDLKSASQNAVTEILNLLAFCIQGSHDQNGSFFSLKDGISPLVMER
ncbi:MAG: hypothetical protein ABSF48_04280 [Thermodesulfobacteriota bacterium]|jgi:hypothetical protein